jgi:hypothetical protein
VAQRVPEGLGSQISWHSAREGGEVSLTHRPPLPSGMFLVLIFTRGWVDSRAMELSEGELSPKNPVTPPGIDPGTFRLVAQRLNHYATPGPSFIKLPLKIFKSRIFLKLNNVCIIITLQYIMLPLRGSQLFWVREVALPRSRATQCLGVYLGNPFSRGPPSWSLVVWLNSPRKTSHVMKPEEQEADPILGYCVYHHQT